MRQPSIIRSGMRIALCAISALLLTACGQKGDLYLPDASTLLIVIF